MSPGTVAYPSALNEMDRIVSSICEDLEPERVWLLEHPHLYTAGTSAKAADLLDPDALPVYPVRRGGQYTYHGPGQRIAYAFLDLKQRGSDIRLFVRDLEQWLIETLAEFGIEGERRDGRIGIWVVTPEGEAKIAAIGVRVRRWVTSHGIALNVRPELDRFRGIVPCGIGDFGVTSMAALGIEPSMAEVDDALKRSFERVFDRTTEPLPPSL